PGRCRRRRACRSSPGRGGTRRRAPPPRWRRGRSGSPRAPARAPSSGWRRSPGDRWRRRGSTTPARTRRMPRCRRLRPRPEGTSGPRARPVLERPPRTVATGARRGTGYREVRRRGYVPSVASPTAAYSIRLRVRLDNRPGSLGRLATAIGDAGGNITAIGGFDVRGPVLEEDLVVNCRDEAHIEQVRAAAEGLEGCEVLEVLDRTFLMHDGGKIEVLARMPVSDRDDLSMAYTPGVARVCQAIAQDPQRVHDLTIKKNTVAIVSDGSAVLGLGRIGPEAALPVMEGKALLFKHFAGVDAFPICLDVGSAEEIVETVARIAPAFGGINLEDIAAPECFEVEERLKERLDIPVFHDDQHGTAVVTLAALENALKLVGKKMSDLRVVIAGVGAAGVAISKILLSAGVGEIIGVDRKGAIWAGRDDLNVAKLWFAENTNPERREGSLAEVLPGSDVFIGVSGPGLVTAAELRTMAPDPIVFAL